MKLEKRVIIFVKQNNLFFMGRLCIYNKDIQLITGKSERSCRKIIAQIRKLYNKQKHQSITIDEFCQYQGLNCEEVRKLIK